MAAIDAVGLQRLEDVAGVLVGTLGRVDRLRRRFEELRIFRLEPVAGLGGVAEIAAGFAVDPVRHVDPARDLVGALAVPGQIFR